MQNLVGPPWILSQKAKKNLHNDLVHAKCKSTNTNLVCIVICLSVFYKTYKDNFKAQ